MTTVGRLLIRKRDLIARLRRIPGPQERDEIESLRRGLPYQMMQKNETGTCALNQTSIDQLDRSYDVVAVSVHRLKSVLQCLKGLLYKLAS